MTFSELKTKILSFPDCAVINAIGHFESVHQSVKLQNEIVNARIGKGEDPKTDFACNFAKMVLEEILKNIESGKTMTAGTK